MSKLEVEDRAGGVKVIRLNRPEKHNALDTPLTAELHQALHQAATEEDCRVIVLCGQGPSFCAGADTSEFDGLADGGTASASQRADLTAGLHSAFTEIDRPVIAAVHGNALGGGAGLALACDLIVAAEDMRFGYPELRHGIVPAVVMANLVRQVGRKQAFALIATARPIDGAEAVRLGIAIESVPGPLVLERALAIAGQLAFWSPVAMRTTKRLFHRAANLPLDEALRAGRDTNLIMRGFPRAVAKGLP